MNLWVGVLRKYHQHGCLCYLDSIKVFFSGGFCIDLFSAQHGQVDITPFQYYLKKNQSFYKMRNGWWSHLAQFFLTSCLLICIQVSHFSFKGQRAIGFLERKIKRFHLHFTQIVMVLCATLCFLKQYSESLITQ